jgi:hypothetical protein
LEPDADGLGTYAGLTLLFDTEASGLSMDRFVVLAIVNYQDIVIANGREKCEMKNYANEKEVKPR